MKYLLVEDGVDELELELELLDEDVADAIVSQYKI